VQAFHGQWARWRATPHVKPDQPRRERRASSLPHRWEGVPRRAGDLPSGANLLLAAPRTEHVSMTAEPP
jgi:hypothetical protein